MKKRTHRHSRRRSRNPTLPELEQLPEGGLARSKIVCRHVCAGAPISTHPLSTAVAQSTTKSDPWSGIEACLKPSRT